MFDFQALELVSLSGLRLRSQFCNFAIVEIAEFDREGGMVA